MKAVVFVDVQKDFIDGALRNEKAIETTPKIVEFAKKCVDDDSCVIYATRDTHKKTTYATIHKLDGTIDKNTPWSGYLASLEGRKLPVEHCIEGTDGWQIDSRLLDVFYAGERVNPYTLKETSSWRCRFVNKPTFGSFDLAEIIAEDFKRDDVKLDEIILCGYCTDICCVSCALLLRAKFPNTKITVMKDLCAGVTPETHDAALKTMAMCQIDIA